MALYILGSILKQQPTQMQRLQSPERLALNSKHAVRDMKDETRNVALPHNPTLSRSTWQLQRTPTHRYVGMVMDYRSLNKVTIKLKCPFPRVDDLLDDLGGARNSTNLDLLSGYHRIRI
jgi:hypothetical protein